jgi:hypothetical protein
MRRVATAIVSDAVEWSTCIMGAPRTKKNSAQIARTRDGRMFIVQSEPLKKWTADARVQLQAAWGRRPALEHGVNLCATFYRDKDIGDLGNYLAALCDVLQRQRKYIKAARTWAVEWPGIVADDRLILGFDGSRLKVDRDRPRVELTLTSLRDP